MRENMTQANQAQKFQIKLFLENPEGLDLAAVIPVFHDLIREKQLPELLIDVADYAHVHQGPGVVLIGHGYDLYLDLREGRPGLLFNRKRDAEGGVEAVLNQGLDILLRAAARLEERLPIRVGTERVQIRAIDRLRTPNCDETHAFLQPIVAKVASRLGAVKESVRGPAGREAYTLELSVDGGKRPSELIAEVAA